MFYSVTPVYITTSLLPFFLHGVYIGVLASIYWLLEYTVDLTKINRNLPLTKHQTFALCVFIHFAIPLCHPLWTSLIAKLVPLSPHA